VIVECYECIRVMGFLEINYPYLPKIKIPMDTKALTLSMEALGLIRPSMFEG
jgi:hypothetical protein